MTYTIHRQIAVVCLTLLCLFATATNPVRAQSIEVDLELVLAVDVSGSMDAEEHQLQRAGYVAALRHPSLWSAIETGAYQRIALSYMEWAGPVGQQVIMPWTLIDSRAALDNFADRLEATEISYIRGTSISEALQFAAEMIDGNGFDGFRRVIDISGDGANNMGPPVVPSRDAVLARGITINGLPLLLRPSFSNNVRLDDYYRDCVIGGIGAFVYPVQDRSAVVEAIRRKLVLEISYPGGPLPNDTGAAAPQLVQETDCMIGEKMRRYWDDS